MRNIIAKGGFCGAMIIASVLIANAQGGGGTIPNASFEQYSTVSVPVPSNWEHSTESFKILYFDQYTYGISQEQPGFSGNYGLRIEVPNNPIDTFFGMQIVTLPTTYTPASLEFWSFSVRYKYFPNNVGDTATLLVLGFDDTLGLSSFGIIDIGGTAANYTSASAPIYVNLSAYGYAANVKYWVFLISPVNPGCTLVLDSISVFDGSGNYYSAFPLNPDFENWYYPSVDTFKYWIVDAAFEHIAAPTPFGSVISTISATSKADVGAAPYGNVAAVVAPADRQYISDTPYNALFQMFEANSLFDFDFAYKYTSPNSGDSASFVILLSDANSSNAAYFGVTSLPQTGNNWVTVNVPLTTLCAGCQIDTVLMAFMPQRVYVDTTGQIIGLPVDTAARLYIDMTVAGCVDTMPQAQFAYSTNGLTITVLDSSLYADSIVWDFGDGTTIVGGDSVSYTYNNDGTYQVCQYAFNTCQQVDTMCTSVSVTPVSAEKPDVSEQFTLVTKGGSEFEIISNAAIQQVQVINTSGQVVQVSDASTKTRTYTLDMRQFGKGVYFIKVTTMKGTDIVKINVR